MVTWAKENGCPLPESTFFEASVVGNMDAILWLYENDCPKKCAVLGAAATGKMNLQLWLYDHAFPINNYSVCLIAAKKGHLQMLEWMKENERLMVNRQVYEMTLREHHLNVVKWLKEQSLHHTSWDAEGSNAAARYERQEIFQWLIENGCPWNDQTGVCAVHMGGVGGLPFLQEKGYPYWTAELCSEAASNWNFEALKWLREMGCPWDGGYYTAAVRGFKDRQKYLKEKNNPLDWECFEKEAPAFALGADIVMMKWLKEKGCPMTGETSAKVAA